MGAIDRFLRRGRQQEGYKPLMKRLEAAMLAACRAAGASAWYVPDDFLTLGPELVPSGSFDSSVGWTLGAGWAISGGKLTATAAATGSNLVINAGLVAGKNYLITYEIDSISAGATTPIANGATSTQQTTSGQKVSFITPAGSTGNVGLNSSSATALTASFDNFSVREILSAKDFQDSGGVAPSYIGGTVGALIDGGYGWEYGPELVFDTAFDNPSAWALSQPTAGAVSITGGALSISSTDGSYCQAAVYPFVGAAIGKTVEYVIEVAAASGGGVVVSYGGAASPAYTTPGIYRGLLTATSTSALLIRRAAVVASSGIVTTLSVRERKGNHVTQATAGNRPTITRIPRKLGPELVTNGAFDSGSGWTLAASGSGSAPSISGGQLVFNSATSDYTFARRFDSAPLEVGKTYAASVDVVSYTSGTFQIVAIGGTATVVNNTITSAGKKQFVFTATQPNYGVEISRASGASFGASFDNISVREVLEWSYALTFDGSNDSLAAPSSIIGATLTQPYTMIQAFRTGLNGTGQRIQGDTARWAAIGSTNKLVLTHQGSSFVAGASDVAVGELVVFEATWDGTTAKIWKNGVLDGQGALAAPTGVTPGAHNVGHNGGGNYFKGEVAYDLVVPFVMTDAQRAAVRKFAAAQMGMTL